MRWLLFAPSVAALALIAAVEKGALAQEVVRSRAAAPRQATALVLPASGSEVVGVVRFWETGAGTVGWDVELHGLEPGPHGFHVHETGDCSAPDATSAGGHFDPTGSPHGAPDADQRHVGDLGNVVADADGTVRTSGVDARLTLRGRHSILDRAVIVHAQRDDLRSQPTGDAGGRLGCGVIRVVPAGTPPSTEDR